jgi:hypothetical protein
VNERLTLAAHARLAGVSRDRFCDRAEALVSWLRGGLGLHPTRWIMSAIAPPLAGSIHRDHHAMMNAGTSVRSQSIYIRFGTCLVG